MEYGLQDDIELMEQLQERSTYNRQQLEQALAAMSRGDVGQVVTDIYHQMLEEAVAIERTAHTTKESELRPMQAVADGYAAAPYAGDKKYLQEEG